ncbi:large conductance mechanosensitive channel protein MscL (plasmid) [Lichenicola cladoniae]|uniref:Large-conductance mechanosensitive channel n=1 Tax=Lichenicola cladoniae TaxID=1484109 RepID=A0A6M8HXT3_9PROT|nr:large conductance mechanosensitive channel protein MscL [Lichenicola cladoniae]NPD69011.1 large conductance mechanosensitive channel protein MscL [Acetobacteraceae bacterium]QKE93359.1 large conductance mechanosensitive channel protein MscL [Lichenicola cladoniae]
MALKVTALHTPGWIGEFRAFIMRGNVVDLAVGIIIGASLTTIVQSLVKDIFTPLIGLLVGNIDFSDIFFTLKGEHYKTLVEAQKAGVPTVNVGIFLNAVIQFLIVGLVIFWVVKLLTRMHVTQAAKTAVAEPTPSELLLMEIRDLMAQTAGRVPKPNQ